ncbi:MAG: thermonuclease family protein [Alphaproteobacteria bacterium]|nr:thermonuclease family protein [Alphaproteobacteria bacterium]
MNKICVAILGVAWSVTALALPARVEYILDGDTFSAVASLDKSTTVPVRVRIRNVDTPEIKGDCEYERTRARAARDRLAEIIPVGSVVELTNVKDDKYLGRIDANVKNSRGDDVGDILIREKFGRKYNGGRRRSWCG